MQHTIHLIPVSDLSVHPVNRGLPAWGPDDPRFLALCDNIAEAGILVPLIADEHNRVIDGAHRLRAAKKLKLDKVPVEVRAGEDVNTIIVSTLAARKHLTKSQRAYICAPLFEDMWQEGLRRRQANNIRTNGHRTSTVRTAEQLAIELGISPRLLMAAREVHRLFREHADFVWVPSGADAARNAKRIGLEPGQEVTLQQYFEPLVLDEEEPIGLGAVAAGIGMVVKGQDKSAGGRPSDVMRQLELFSQVVDTELKRWSYWDKFDAETKARHWQVVREKAQRMEPTLCLELAEYHRTMAKEFASAAKTLPED